MVVQSDLSQQQLQLPVLFLQMLQPTGVTDLHVTVLGFPPLKGLFADPMATAHVLGFLASLGLLQHPYDLLFFKSRPPSCISYLEDSRFTWTYLRGAGQPDSGKARRNSVDITAKVPDRFDAVWDFFMLDLAEGVGFEPTNVAFRVVVA